MKNSPRLAPILVGVSVALSSAAPRAALSQVITRPVTGSAATPMASVHGVSALSPLAAAAPISGIPAFGSSLEAPAAPMAAPAPTAIAAANASHKPPTAYQGLRNQLPDLDNMGVSSAKDAAGVDFLRRIGSDPSDAVDNTPGNPGAPDPSQAVSNDSLRAVNEEVLRLRDEVWKGRLAPASFYPAVEALFAARFGESYGEKIRGFLDHRTAERPTPSHAVDFTNMTAKDRAEFFRQLPKGADLHMHLNGSIQPQTWLQIAEELHTEFQIQTLVTLLKHMGEDPAAYGLNSDQGTLSIHAMTPELKNAVQRMVVMNERDKTFQDFLKKWMLIGAMTKPEAYETMIRSVAKAAKRQNILYLEIMLASLTPPMDKAVEALSKIQKETGVELRIIGSGGWNMKPEDAARGMAAANQWSRSGVVGFNMMADEFQFRPLLQYEPFQRLREGMPRLAVALHAGEQPKTADNMVNDLLLNVKRYGHATHVEENPIAMALLYAQKTPVEVSLISNQMTQVMSDLSSHPLPKMLAWGVPIILTTDDPGIFGSSLSAEYELAQRQFNLGWDDLKEISRNGIRHSFLDSKTKQKLLHALDARFERFERSPVFLKHQNTTTR